MFRRYFGSGIGPFIVIGVVLTSCSGGVGIQSLPADLPAVKSSPHYTAVDLGTLGGSFSETSGISNTGVVSGYSATKGDAAFKVFAWRHGHLKALEGFGGPISYSWTINNNDTQSGFSETVKRDPNGEDVNGLGTHLISLPAVWSNGKIETLPLIGGNNGNALGLNNVGEIGGWSETDKRDSNCVKPQVLQIVPVLWNGGKVEGTLPIAHGDDFWFAWAAFKPSTRVYR